MINAQEIQGQWNTLRGKVKEKWGQLTNDDLQLVGGNVDQLIGRIQQKTGQERRVIEDFISHLVPDQSTIQQGVEAARQGVEAASQYVQDATEGVREGFEQVSEQARQGYTQAERYVKQHPGESLSALFGTGLIAGVLVGLLLHSETTPRHNSWMPW